MITSFFLIAVTAVKIVLVPSVSKCVVSLNKHVFAEGLQQLTPNGYRFCAYNGIPYAAPPIGKNRFELPIKIPLWRGKKQFTKEGNVCTQFSDETREIVGSEDCLFLNIFTVRRQEGVNNESIKSLLPVLFWIHGGSYIIGSASSDMNGPEYFLEKDIVVVAINYRLGPLGFLSYGNLTKNIGLHDQNMALQWIHENIRHFGGDPQKITLGGWSAGAASVSFHLYANKSRNLFDKAIMMSGSMLDPWSFESNLIRCTYRLLEKLNIQNCTSVVNDLKTTDAYDFMLPLFSDDLIPIFFGSPQTCFVPTFDDEFSINWPHILTEQTPMSNVPIMIGLTNLEHQGIRSFDTSYVEFPNKNQSQDQSISESIVDYITQRFVHDVDRIGDSLNISKSDKIFWHWVYPQHQEHFMQSFEYISTMSYGVHKFIEQYVNVTKQESVFLYRFAFDGKFGNYKRNSSLAKERGSMHGDDLGYIFKDYYQAQGIPYNTTNLTSEFIMRERMVTMWTNFIKFGNPTPNTTDIVWPPFNNDEKLFFNIDADITTEKLNENDRVFQLWDAIYQCLYYVQCDKVNEYLHNNKSIIF